MPKKILNLPLFTFLGFLRDWKGIDLLLQATALALRQEVFLLRIIGDDSRSEKTRLETLAKTLKISDYVRFFGFVPQNQCPSLLKESRALVLPSLYECGGAVVLEAMAMGIPVIATNWGGPTDYITPDCGILVAPRSRTEFIAGLAEAMVHLARNEKLAESMGEQGRQRVEALFSWQKKIDRILEIYAQVAKGDNSFLN